MAALAAKGCRIFLEVGPHPALTSPGRQCITGDGCHWVHTLQRDHDEWESLLQGLAKLYVEGFAVNWPEFYREGVRSRTPLPHYPFQRQKYWPSAPVATHSVRTGASHPLVGQHCDQRQPTRRFSKGSCRQNGLRFLPTTACSTSRSCRPRLTWKWRWRPGPNSGRVKALAVEDLQLRQILPLPPGMPQTVQVVLSPEEGGLSFEVFRLTSEASDPNAEWSLHASGRLSAPAELTPPEPLDPWQLQVQFPDAVDPRDHYDEMRMQRLDYGPCFQAISRLWRRRRRGPG